MIKNHQADSKSSACWSKETQVQSLRVELNGGTFFVFPYIHLMFAKMEHEEKQDVLVISFSTHEIHIVGRNLKELGIALQRFSVDWIKETPSRYAALSRREAVFIERIEVAEASEQTGA